MKHKNVEHLQRAHGNHSRALEESALVGGSHMQSFATLSRCDEQLCRADSHVRALREAIDSGDKAAALEAHGHLQRALGKLGDRLSALHDQHGEAASAHRGLRDQVQQAHKHVRAVLDDEGIEAGKVTPSVTDVQTSDGIEDDTGNLSGRSFADRQRERDRLRTIGAQYEEDYWRVQMGRR
jgi:hypothetical protein